MVLFIKLEGLLSGLCSLVFYLTVSLIFLYFFLKTAFLGIPIFPISTPSPEDPIAGDIKGKYSLFWFNFNGSLVLRIFFFYFLCPLLCLGSSSPYWSLAGALQVSPISVPHHPSFSMPVCLLQDAP